ncbi:MAG: hypothetical protein NAOJABEB_02892 [Steroidobacteraceae bacterium]|nr:hypothetical protein [Steroidobacteraceae bacterium]
MSANSLLLWMSARRHGSWAQFRAAVEELHLEADVETDGEGDDAPDQFALPLYQTLRFNLQRVGHAEFFAGAGEGAEWRVTPPSLAVTRHARGWLGVVAGARSVSVTDRLRSAAATHGAELRVLEFASYPDQIVITANTRETLTAVAERAGFLLQDDAPAALLASLPPVDDPSVRYQTELPFGSDWRIDRFSADDLVWRSATLDDARTAPAGLFRFALRHQGHVLFCCRGAAARIPAQVGKYLVLRQRRHRRQVLRYDAQKRTLSMPASCRPPFLVERALILCSGLPPSYEGSGLRGGSLQYPEIPQDIAAIAAALLRQELR